MNGSVGVPAKKGPTHASILAGGVSHLAEIEKLSYQVYGVQLCTKATEVFDLYDDVIDANNNIVVQTAIRSLAFEEGDCVDLGIGVPPDGGGVAPLCGTESEAWVDLVDSAEVAEKLNATLGIPAGTYRYVVVNIHPRVGLQASVNLRDNEGTMATLFTKACGPATCNSNCDYLTENGGSTDDWGMSTCKGPIPAPFQGSELGETHPTTGDVWASSPYDTFDATNGRIGENNRYWRRCDHDMLQGPAQQVFTESRRDDSAFELLVPLVVGESRSLTPDAGPSALIDAGNDAVDAGTVDAGPIVFGDDLEVMMLYSLTGAVTGTVEPMEQTAMGPDPALGHTQFYGISDGFHGIFANPLPLTAVARSGGESIKRFSYVARVRQASARPACFLNGPDEAPSFAGPGFDTPETCHPCHGLEVLCREGSTGVPANDRKFRMEGMQPSQDFDLAIDVYQSVDLQTGLPLEPIDIRAVQVTAYFASGEAIRKAIPFPPFAASSIELNADGSINLVEQRSGLTLGGVPVSGAFPRIRNLPVGLAEREEGNVIVELSYEGIANQEPECGTCGYFCETVVCDSTNAYFEVPIELQGAALVERNN